MKEKVFVIEIEKALAPYLTKASFIAGQILWNEGESAGKMLSIIKGRVKIFRPLSNGKQASIYIFGPGDIFGFLPFIDGAPYPASAEVLENMQALVMTREKLLEAMKQDPYVAIFLLEHLAKRLRSAFDQIERLSTRGVLSRVAAAMVSLSVSAGEKENLQIITLPVSSHEYAALVGLTPESFSRGVTKLVDMGIIHRLKGNSFQILDPIRLSEQSHNDI